MGRVLAVITFASFVSSLFIRMTDPLVPQIAVGFAVEPRTAALLSTVFAIPWALSQPLLGPIGDLLGKTRVILTCLLILFLSTIIGVFATSFPLLMASRIVAGMAAGGVFPVSVALFGDLVAVEERQVRMGSLLAWSITGTLLGAVTAGILGDVIHWRWILRSTASPRWRLSPARPWRCVVCRRARRGRCGSAR
jgi:MFS family permease